MLTKLFFSLCTVMLLAASCTKEKLVPAPTTLDLIVGKFKTTHLEQEIYSNGVLDSKIVKYFTGFFFELKKDSSYFVTNQDGTTSGIWELVSSNYLVLDKNTTGERYFYIIYIDTKSFLLRGPFKKNGDLKFNYITNTYYER